MKNHFIERISFQKKSGKSHDITSGSMLSFILNVASPLLIGQIISILISGYNNAVYVEYLGKIAFLVTGVLSSSLGIFTNVYTSVTSAAWFKSAHIYTQEDHDRRNHITINALYAVLLTSLFCMVVLFAGKNLIFRLIAVPEEISYETTLYYIFFALQIPLNGVLGLLGTIVTAGGKGSEIFFHNTLGIIVSPLAAFLSIVVLKMGYWGFLVGGIPFLFLRLALYSVSLRRHGIFVGLKREHFLPDFRFIFQTIYYGSILFLQCLLTGCGAVLLSTQSNRFLDMDVIAAVSVSLPIYALFNICNPLINVFVTQNFWAGKTARLKKFVKGILTFVVLYALLCTAFYCLAGEWYFRTLFEEETLISLGKQYWFWFGLSMLPLSMLYTVRPLLDCVGLAKISLLAGLAECIGYIISAFWLIPRFGYVGRFASSLLGFGMAASVTVIMFLILKKNIYKKCDENTR